jgi:flagellar hook-associated protein 1 FlgK
LSLINTFSSSSALPATFFQMATDMVSNFGVRGEEAIADLAFATARHDELFQSLAGQGVDSDAELQKLLLIEQSYAANARVMQAVDEMLQRLMEI